MKLLVASIAKSSNDPLLTEGHNYLARLHSPLSISCLLLNPKIPSSMPEELRKVVEGKELLNKTEGYFRIALTETGKSMNSEQLAQTLEKLMHTQSKTAFIIGGAFGLSVEVVRLSNMTLSLSPLTLPHRMAFLVLSEQLYRAQEIIKGTPYHK